MMVESDGKRALFEMLGYEPHEGQVSVHNLVDNHQVTTVVLGRQAGKTTLAIYEAIYRALQAADEFGPPLIYVVSDTFDHSSRVFEPLVTLFSTKLSKFREHINKKERTITLKGGAKIKAKSAETPTSLASETLSFVILEESGFISNEAVNILRPSLIVRNAPILAIGTPDRADTWFKTFFDYGFDEGLPEYTSIQMPSSVNPRVTKEFLEREKRTYPEAEYRRMYLAEFIEGAENPFSVLLTEATINKETIPPAQGRKYVAGVDLADRTDYTVVVVVDVTEKPFKVVKVARWNGIGYPATGERIAKILKEYNNARAWVDRTGVGDAAIPFITKHYGNVIPVVFTQQEKQNMFDTITTYMEQGNLHLLDSNQLIEELRVLRAVRTLKGISYKAPQGQKDDAPMALFLAGKGFDNNFYIPRNAGLGGFRTPL